MVKNYFIKTPLGNILIGGDKSGIESVTFIETININNSHPQPNIKDCENQLIDYFNGEVKKFNVKLNPKGTPFQKKVWKCLAKVPYGKTAAYSDIAKQMGNPKAVRAVAGACKRNPIPIIIPCHRVTGKNGNLTGFSSGLWRKKWLLKHESQNK
ncbi:MAG: methylated-DNA--[protein]-cysteine S-methyltransferase [bacterium]